ncbi:hypothetical protein ABXV18_27025 [Vibrio owensii]|uniref:hypothetical protein n=1 Tax=Vibrio owensii TaxID=696485 RepID=UPI0033922CF2
MLNGSFYKMDAEGNVSPCKDFLEYVEQFGSLDRIIDQTTIEKRKPLRKGGRMLAKVNAQRALHGYVSTVFLCLAHGIKNDEPVLFETMVFGGRDDGLMIRATTKSEAEAIHNKVVKRVKTL